MNTKHKLNIKALNIIDNHKKNINKYNKMIKDLYNKKSTKGLILSAKDKQKQDFLINKRDIEYKIIEAIRNLLSK